MVVMVPWSESMTRYKIDPAEVDNLVYAFQYLRGLEYVDPERVGMGGFCVGASLSMVAAQDSRIREDVAFVNSFGGYFDVKDLMVSIASRARFDEDSQEPWEPSRQTLETFRNHLIESVESPEERELLTRVFAHEEEPAPGDVENLSDTGKTVYSLLRGVSKEEADEAAEQDAGGLPEGDDKHLSKPKPGRLKGQAAHHARLQG